jgi:hypothetical protein
VKVTRDKSAPCKFTVEAENLAEVKTLRCIFGNSLDIIDALGPSVGYGWTTPNTIASVLAALREGSEIPYNIYDERPVPPPVQPNHSDIPHF